MAERGLPASTILADLGIPAPERVLGKSEIADWSGPQK
jgi:hypothetical protein